MQACQDFGMLPLPMRIELMNKKHLTDGRAAKLKEQCHQILGIEPSDVQVVDVYLFSSDFGLSREALREIFCDDVAQDFWYNESAWKTRKPKMTLACEIAFKAGVTDPVAITAASALRLERGSPLPVDALVQTARQIWFNFTRKLSDSEQAILVRGLYNPLIQREEVRSKAELEAGNDFPSLYKGVQVSELAKPELIAVHGMNDQELLKLSKDRLLALTLEEMKIIKHYFADPKTQAARKRVNIGVEALDVELEMIAQSWSEHCKHKLFAAHIEYTDETTGNTETVKGLFKTCIRETTEELSAKRPDLRSVFHDNSGVVDFDDDHVVCFKVETHNSPSALDPYGGAITGIVGVNRDILGTGKGAAPIFNTNYLCFADPSTDPKEVPKGLLHPRKVMEGVHEGIIDGGNQSGIPTVGGGFLFDESYLGKPLVYCGTGGIMPRFVQGEESWIKHIDAGDLAVMVGGRIGKDGIHGATFSSLALDEDSPSSAVQIGDPITQRKVWDFLIEARDKGFYKGITDNGAGGLSSSLGEMAQYSNGIRVDLDRCPLKYPGLAPWEIWVSESQERMSLAVDSENLDDFLALAKARDVEASVIGVFTDSGFVELYYDGDPVGYLGMDFIHEGLPPLQLKARWPKDRSFRGPAASIPTLEKKLGPANTSELWLRILGHPNVRSKEGLVRRYDHEVQGRTIVQGFRGMHTDAPTDGAVIRPVAGSIRGLSVTHGVCPRVGDDDAYKMAVIGFDEAYRSHIALGGDPDKASALDNFCWPDPVEGPDNSDGQYKLAQLVRSNKGLRDACLAYNVPLVSGKDSMKNDARVGGKKISVRPTLLISMMGIVPDSRYVPASGFTKAGLKVVLIGKTQKKLGGSIVEHLAQNASLKDLGIGPIHHYGEAPELDLTNNPVYYRHVAQAIRLGLIASIHDISDGGLAVALAESSFHQRLGVDIRLPEGQGATWFFAEHPSCYVAGIEPAKLQGLRAILGDERVTVLGDVLESGNLRVQGKFGGVDGMVSLPMEQALKAWKAGW